MAKRPPPLDDALRAQFAAAREADRIADAIEPRADYACYEIQKNRVFVELRNGGAFAFPPSLIPELRDATPQELFEVTVSPSGEGLYWEDLDVHVETAGALVALLGPSMFRAFASVGGRATSERKAAAARANGRKGGRPRKNAGAGGHPSPYLDGTLKVAERGRPFNADVAPLSRPPGAASDQDDK